MDVEARATVLLLFVLTSVISGRGTFELQTSAANHPPFSFPCSNNQCVEKNMYLTVNHVSLTCKKSSRKSFHEGAEFEDIRAQIVKYFNEMCLTNPTETRALNMSSITNFCTQQSSTPNSLDINCDCVSPPASTSGNFSTLSTAVSTYLYAGGPGSTYSTAWISNTTEERAGQQADSLSTVTVVAASIGSVLTCCIVIGPVVMCKRRKLVCFKKNYSNEDSTANDPKPSAALPEDPDHYYSAGDCVETSDRCSLPFPLKGSYSNESYENHTYDSIYYNEMTEKSQQGQFPLPEVSSGPSLSQQYPELHRTLEASHRETLMIDNDTYSPS